MLLFLRNSIRLTFYSKTSINMPFLFLSNGSSRQISHDQARRMFLRRPALLSILSNGKEINIHFCMFTVEFVLIFSREFPSSPDTCFNLGRRYYW
ncbi:hypothetical protein C0J52_11060 [Blattella germanica]|nr:hypothetical protein C0J52_11060 [Blattella germanica]